MSLDAPVHEQILDAELADRVLDKLGLAERPTIDIEGLTKVYKAWCRNVPFDNLRKLIHLSANDPRPLPGSTPEDFFQAWLVHNTGGTCWSANGALHALLASLGFQTIRGIGTMMVSPNLPPNHGTVLVDLDDIRYLTDASILHDAPLPLDLAMIASLERRRPQIEVTLTNDKWHIWWRPLHILSGIQCRIDSFPATLSDFQQRHEETRSWSPFNYQLVSRKIVDDRSVGIGYGRWVELPSDDHALTIELNAADRAKQLIEALGYSEEIVSQLPADRTTPPPPWSTTAKQPTN